MNNINSPLSIVELAWAAGFYDGEGCMTLKIDRIKSKGDYYLRHALTMQVTQASKNNVPEVLLRFQKAVDNRGKIYTFTHKNTWTTRYDWKIYGFAVFRVVLMLWPYLSSVKREQIITQLSKTQHFNIPLPLIEGWEQWRIEHYPNGIKPT